MDGWRWVRRLWSEGSVWQRWGIGVGAGVLAAALVFAIGRLTAPPPAAEPLSLRILGKAPYRPVVLGFYENDSSPGAHDGSWDSLRQNVRDIDLLSPYWYRVGNGGLIALDKSDPKVVRFANQHHVRVWPLVGNDGYDMLATPSARRQTVRTLVALALRNGYDGIFVDFELVPANQRDNFSTFINELSQALHRRRLGLGVAVYPKVDVTPDVQGVYDYPALGGLADAVVVMTYDHHQDSSPPGPVAPLNWVRTNMTYAIRRIAREKVFLGVAAYGYDWTAPGQAETLSTVQVESLLSRLGIRPTWSRFWQEPHFYYTDNSGKRHTVWYEDAFTFGQKFDLARGLKLGGFAIWRLGYEEPSFWAQLDRQLHGETVKPLPPASGKTTSRSA